jgi:hypothetical protein
MDDSEPLNGFPPLFDDDAFEAVRRRMDMPSRQGTTHDVRELEGQHQEWYPESALERHHPHVVERLVLLWGFSECGTWLDSLVIDWRGNRNGFKREVMDELLFLHALFPYIVASSSGSPDSSAWHESGRYMR